MEEDDGFADGVMHPCPACGHLDWYHPEMVSPEGNTRCAECNADLGPWDELRSRLFKGDAMLAAALAKKS